MQQNGLFIAKLIVRSICFGHHYAHQQELKSYADGCCLWYLALWFTGRWSGVVLYNSWAPDDGHNGARNMLSEQWVLQ